MKPASFRARRLGRYNQLRKKPGINLVSLMDIFTILVFFLLINTSTEKALPSAKVLTLPASVSQTAPEETLRIILTEDDVLVQNRRVMTLADIAQAQGETLAPLREELAYRRSLAAGEGRDTLTVIADQSIPYDIIRRVIQTGRELEYSRIAFAADQTSLERSELAAGGHD
ncbi:ExbD/TolR family protein [Marinimicrobium alkaliphilum]|uniref:ExbD/TolR family protein n=1 Tax=Marinimicrobium alkaliphilum TaxID=2202654 RepID=UPI000DBAA8C6|nr:biopolymer transporter ExbD [Marinimicrobium alkaliphilum]